MLFVFPVSRMAVFNNQLAIFFKIQQSLSVSRHKLALGHHWFTLNFQKSSPRYGRWLFPDGSLGKEFRRHGRLRFHPWVGKIPWRKVWHGNPLQYSCLENSHGQRILEGYHPWGCKESDTTESKHSSSIMLLSKSFVSVIIMIPLIKPKFHSESLQLFWLPNPSIASFFGKISALCWICYYIRICMLRNSEKNAQPHELWQQSYAS